MRERWRAWLAPTAEDPDLARRQRLLNLVLLGLAGPGFLFGLSLAVVWAFSQTPGAGVGAVAGLGVQPIYLLSYWLGRRGRVRLAAYIPVIVLFLIMTGATYQVGAGHVTLVGYALATTTAGLLIGISPALFFALLSMVVYLIVGLAQPAGQMAGTLSPEVSVLADGIGLGLGLIVLVIFDWLAGREMGRALRREQELSAELRAHRAALEQEVADRTAEVVRRAVQLQTAAEVARDVVAIRDVDELLRQTAQLISERFGFYHAGIFMLDEAREYAVLRAASSEGGQRMLARGHKLKVGEVGIVGHVAGTGQPRVALDVGQDAVFFNNPDLPQTRSEMALPLRVRGLTIGVLDVQSTAVGAFTEEDIAALQILADQLAVGLENARLLAQAQSNLEELNRLHRVMTGEAWQRFVEGRPEQARYQVGVSPGPPEIWAALFAQARHQGQPVSGRLAVDGGPHALVVPVKLRDVSVGVIGFHRPAEAGEWQPEEIALAEGVAERAALALENVRLLEETQRRAAQEQLLAEITARVRASTEIDAILRTSIRELGRALRASDGLIRLEVSAETR